MIPAPAPASVALRAFTAKPHVPRSTRAILPATAPGLVNAEQPSVVAVPAGSEGSRAATTAADTFGDPTRGPKAAVPNCSDAAMAAGCLTCSSGLPNDRTLGSAASTPGASSTTRPNRVAAATRSALVIWIQYLPVDVSSRN